MKLNVALGIHPKVEHYDVVKRAIEEEGDSVKIYSDETSLEGFEADSTDFIVSYGYKYLIKGALLEKFAGRIINLHPSFLPWGRGYFPNFWSHVFDFPNGVTLHLIDEGIDTGSVLFQREHSFAETETLRTSYYTLQTSMLCLFTKAWRDIRTERVTPIGQDLDNGNLAYEKDFKIVFPLLQRGFDTSLAEVHAMRDEIKDKLLAAGRSMPRKTPVKKR